MDPPLCAPFRREHDATAPSLVRASEKPVYRKPTFREYLLCQATAIRRASATTVVERAASVILPADGPRITPTAHRGTKPQMPCSDQCRSASLPYRPTLAAAAFCNPLAPAHSCRPGRPLTPQSSPTPTVRAAPPFFDPFP